MPRANQILHHHRFSHSQGFPLVRVRATIQTVFPSPGFHHGANHQHFTIAVIEVIDAQGMAASDVQSPIFVATRFGDTEGLDSQVPGLAAGNEIEIQGEYIDAAGAYPTPDNDNPILPVLHFTHHPVGYIHYQGQYYS